MSGTLTITIIREIEIAVTVGFNKGQAPRFYPPDPGEPEEYWIEEATADGEPIELEGSEEERAVKMASDLVADHEDPAPIEPDPDDGIDELSPIEVVP